jgi:CO dehydrogenase maturation factor
MKILFLGKGGSGKTTATSAFITHVARTRPVLAIDADQNAHLHEALGMPGTPIALGDRYSEIATYVSGDRKDLGKKPVIGTTPPSLASRFIIPKPDDPFIRKYAARKGDISLLTVGNYSEKDIGHNCYHGKLESVAMVLIHLLDRPEDIVVADATAGTDVFGTPFLYIYDLHVLVVEPTAKSLNVFKDYYRLTRAEGTRLAVLANKIESEDDLEYIKSVVPPEMLLGAIPYSPLLRAFEQGDDAAFQTFVSENGAIFDEIITRAAAVPRDWSRFLEQLNTVHAKICRQWYNDYYGFPIDTGYDSEFRYETVMQQYHAST